MLLVLLFSSLCYTFRHAEDSYFECLQTFQKLVYVSTLVFGEASKFLLPWKRVFKVTDAQVNTPTSSRHFCPVFFK